MGEPPPHQLGGDICAGQGTRRTTAEGGPAHKLSYFASGIFVEQTLRVTGSQSYQSYVCPYAHTNQYYNSFVPCTIRNWNFVRLTCTFICIIHLKVAFGHTCK